MGPAPETRRSSHRCRPRDIESGAAGSRASPARAPAPRRHLSVRDRHQPAIRCRTGASAARLGRFGVTPRPLRRTRSPWRCLRARSGELRGLPADLQCSRRFAAWHAPAERGPDRHRPSAAAPTPSAPADDLGLPTRRAPSRSFACLCAAPERFAAIEPMILRRPTSPAR